MNTRRYYPIYIAILISALGILTLMAAADRAVVQAKGNPTRPMDASAARTGAWVDTIHISTIPTASTAIQALNAGDIHFYTYALSDPDLLQMVTDDPDLTYYSSYGNYNDLTFNPAGPVFSGTGKLNPFDVPEIREAMNWLIDRDLIVADTVGGLGIPKFTVLNLTDADYTRYHQKLAELEAYYAYNPTLAEAVISAEMLNLGAYKVGELWYYNSEPVTIICIIRTEDERTQIGDYVADQLESIGFTADRLYKTSPEAAAYWISSDPNVGTWHLYTGGWISTNINRNSQDNFGFFYTPRGWLNIPLWQAYTPTPAFDDVVGRLYENDFADMTERDSLFNQALELSLEDSSRIWVKQDVAFTAYRSETRAAFDRSGGLLGSDLWSHTIQFNGLEGGVLNIAQPEFFKNPWNPIGGSGWIYDSFIYNGTGDKVVITDPNTGLIRPQRIISAEVHIETGLPVTNTLDWVSLTFSDTIQVPDDAWSDWNALNQTWISASERFTETQTCRSKIEVHYEPDLFTNMNWHDGNPGSLADFIMYAILNFDRAKPYSAIYDESTVDAFNGFMGSFYGWRITSENPLVVEYYTDDWTLDAENQVSNRRAMYPFYDQGEAPWHTLAVGYLAETAGDLAFSADKANSLGIDWMDFLSDPSLTILDTHLDRARTDSFIPYENTLGAYITPLQAFTRYSNLETWYDTYAHFWVGTGLFYLESADPGAGSLTLQRNPNFPDDAGRWDDFIHDPTPVELEINYPSGAPGSAFNISGTNFPVYSIGWVTVNNTPAGSFFTGPTGDFTLTLTTDVAAQEGTYYVFVSVNPIDSVTYVLDDVEPTHPVEGSHEVIAVPVETIAYTHFIYSPLVIR